MTEQAVTPELRRWIVEQAAAGRSSESVLQAMIDSGWSEDIAIDALTETLTEALQPTAPKQLPGPALDAGTPTLAAGDREVAVLGTLRQPRLVVFGDLLAEGECAELIAMGRRRLARSETVVESDGASAINEARTSDGMFFERGENALVARIEARIAALLNWPVENGEGLQILRYRPGAEYKPHYDYFDPAQPGTPVILKRGGQRLATLVMYLNTPARGGATTFPDVGLEVMPVRGNAVFFSYELPLPATRTLHGGAPVLEGEKWVATKWLRAGRFD
jgi:prolyl 4-hydroxylase